MRSVAISSYPSRGSTIPTVPSRLSTVRKASSRPSNTPCRGESLLLNLPVEIFSLIIETIVRDNALHIAMHLRQVCRTFDNQIFESVCHLRCFEAPASDHNRYQHQNLALRYLHYQTRTSYAKEHYITESINGTVDYILKETPELADRREHIVYELCWCVIQLSGISAIGNILGNRHAAVSLRRSRDNGVEPLNNAFAAAAYLGIMPLLQRLISNPDLVLRRNTSDFGSPVNSAIAGGHIETIALLLDHGFSVDEGRYPSFLSKHHSKALRFLLDRDPEPSVATLRAAIVRATAIGEYNAVVEYMAHLGIQHPEAETAGALKMTLHHWLATSQSDQGFQILFNCILYVAADYGHLDLAIYAVSKGANTNSRPSWSLFDIRGLIRKRSIFSPLELAAKRGYLGLVRYLLGMGAKPTQTALKHASRLGWLDIVRKLLYAGAYLWPPERQPYSDQGGNSWTSGPSCGFYDFPEIVRRGHVDIVKLYLHQGFDKKTDKMMKERAAEGYRIALQEDKREILELMKEYVYDKEDGTGWLRV